MHGSCYSPYFTDKIAINQRSDNLVKEQSRILTQNSQTTLSLKHLLSAQNFAQI